MQQPTVKRKRKCKWQMKQDYIQGYLRGLEDTFNKQVVANKYELVLQLPDVVVKH